MCLFLMGVVLSLPHEPARKARKLKRNEWNPYFLKISVKILILKQRKKGHPYL